MKNAGRTWKKDGFLMRPAVKTDDILMAILEEEWRELYRKE